jgi:hypothetical protein
VQPSITQKPPVHVSPALQPPQSRRNAACGPRDGAGAASPATAGRGGWIRCVRPWSATQWAHTQKQSQQPNSFSHVPASSSSSGPACDALRLAAPGRTSALLRAWTKGRGARGSTIALSSRPPASHAPRTLGTRRLAARGRDCPPRSWWDSALVSRVRSSLHGLRGPSVCEGREIHEASGAFCSKHPSPIGVPNL